MGNSASDIMGIGLWNSFSDQVFGLSAAAGLTMNPASFKVLAFDDNVAFGCKLVGAMTLGGEMLVLENMCPNLMDSSQ